MTNNKAIQKMLLLIFLAFLWGASYPLTKVGVDELPMLTYSLGRAAIGVLILWLVMHLKGQRLPGRDRVWFHLAAMGIIHIAIPFVLIAWGSLSIDSGLAALITSTAPLFTIILAHVWAANDRISQAKLLGVMVAFGGMFILLSPSFGGGLTASLSGVLAIVAASICFAIGNVYTHKYLRGLPSLVGPTGQMMVASAVLLPIALVLERPFQMALPGTAVLLAWIAAAVLSTALAFIVFYRLLEIANATYVGMVSYLIPIVGAVLGVLFLAEQLPASAYAGFAIILTGVLIANGLAVPRFENVLTNPVRKLRVVSGSLTRKQDSHNLPA
jgi:drug/metabolite transporter (DMT)-like permease